MTRVLAVGHFDPIDVVTNHARLLKGTDVDMRIAIDGTFLSYTDTSDRYDWVRRRFTGWDAEHGCAMFADAPGQAAMPGLREFAESADVLVFMPGFSPNFALNMKVCEPFREVEFLWNGWGGIDWLALGRRKRKVAYIHGSRNTWAFREQYRATFAAEGCEFASSTLDYATLMGAEGKPATYLPPILDPDLPLANLREKGQPCVLAHTPSDPGNCSTATLFAIAGNLGVPISYCTNHTRTWAIQAKMQGNAGFDHLRGSFSVNHLENCSMGLASLCGLLPDYRVKLLQSGFGNMPGPRVVDPPSLADAIRLLRDDVDYHRQLQMECHKWSHENFSDEKIKDRVYRFYKEGSCDD